MLLELESILKSRDLPMMRARKKEKPETNHWSFWALTKTKVISKMMTAVEHVAVKIKENLKQYCVSYVWYTWLFLFLFVCVSAASLIYWSTISLYFKNVYFCWLDSATATGSHRYRHQRWMMWERRQKANVKLGCFLGFVTKYQQRFY